MVRTYALTFLGMMATITSAVTLKHNLYAVLAIAMVTVIILSSITPREEVRYYG